MKYNGFSIDIEADGFVFESKNIWVICLEDLDTDEKLQLKPFEDHSAKQKLLEWVQRYDKPNICFHNGLGYDAFVMLFLLGAEFTVGPDTFMGQEVNFVDTFYLSMFLNPDREGHSIEYFGEQMQMPKIDFRQAMIDAGAIPDDSEDGAEFHSYHALMDTYCERDTLVGKMTFKYLTDEWRTIYGSFDPTNWPQHFKSGQKSFYLMSCQELTGWKFDIPAAEKLLERIGEMMEEIRASVEPQLPPRALKKTEESEYKMPAKPFKKDGSYSSQWEKFCKKHNAEDLGDGSWKIYGKVIVPESNKILDVKLPMEMANQEQMKDWFLENGWKPTLWNFKRGPDNKPMRDPVTRQLIKTTPKIQEAGKLCQNLEAMEGDIVKQVVKWLSLRNRQSVLQGWLSNPRLQYDGRIGSGRTGIAATHRQKHKVVVNVPKADPKVLLGYEFRALWIAEDDMLIASADAAALEGRVQGHYTYKYDGGATAEELLKGDVHCFSSDTEILTDHGWVLFSDLTYLSNVAQWSDGHISFVNPTEIIASEYSGEMISFESSSLNKLVTPKHRILTVDYVTDKYTTVSATDLSDRNANTRIPTAGVVISGDTYSEEFVELIAAVQSDGYIQSRESSIVRFEFRRDRKIARMVEILNNLGVKYSMTSTKRGTTKFYVNAGQGIIESVLNFLDCDKNLNSKVLSMSAKSLYSLVQSYSNWDGSVTNNSDIVLDTTSSKTVDILQAACALSGLKSAVTRGIAKKSSFGDCVVDRIYVSNKSKAVVRTYGTKRTESYSGTIHCVTVPSGYVVVRRKDCVCISGNSKNTMAFYGNLYDEVANLYNSPDFDKENPKWKPYRSKSKNGFYAILYGAGAPKVASTLGIPEKYGKEALESFWKANPGTAQLKENLEGYWETTGKKKYLPAIDGRILLTRKKSALLNTIFQSCGGIAMDYACCFMDKWLGGIKFDEKRRPYYLYKGCIVRRVGYFHDEYSFECDKTVAEEVAELAERAIIKAGEFLKLKIPLAGEGKVGASWKEVH